MDLNELLGIDMEDPSTRLAHQLVEQDESMLDALIRLRKSQRKSQAQIGELMGISQSAVARIESGERDPHLSTLRRYAHAVGALVQHQVATFQLDVTLGEAGDSATPGVQPWLYVSTAASAQSHASAIAKVKTSSPGRSDAMMFSASWTSEES